MKYERKKKSEKVYNVFSRKRTINFTRAKYEELKEWRFRILSNILNTRKIYVLGINKHGIKNRFIGSLDKGKKNQNKRLENFFYF